MVRVVWEDFEILTFTDVGPGHHLEAVLTGCALVLYRARGAVWRTRYKTNTAHWSHIAQLGGYLDRSLSILFVFWAKGSLCKIVLINSFFFNHKKHICTNSSYLYLFSILLIVFFSHCTDQTFSHFTITTMISLTRVSFQHSKICNCKP